MQPVLPIPMESLLGGAIEGTRLELKATWDGEVTGYQVLKTLCAFFNDLQNLNGGYVVLGVAEKEGVIQRPVRGLDAAQIEAASKWIRGHCNRMDPVSMPLIETASLDGRKLLLLWAPASDIRPHKVPGKKKDEPKYWVRIGSETIVAKDTLLTHLMQQTARVPFDDRRCMDATLEDLRVALVREFLKDLQSALVSETSAERLYTALHLTRPANGHHVPRNVALLFFSDDPRRWFRGACIEVAQYSDDLGGDVIEEKRFVGPIHHQVRQCLVWLENMSTRHLEKQADRPETRSWISYPATAMREALVNAVYHRDYEHSVEPTKVHLFLDRVEVISYPGPVQGIEERHLRPGVPVPPVPARNRRIGEFLKELRLAEGRGTGLPKMVRSMRSNGSPDPQFDFDQGRSYFRATLPAHPEYVALTALRDAAYFKATGDAAAARRRLQAARESQPHSALITGQLVDELILDKDYDEARRVAGGFLETQPTEAPAILLKLVTALLNDGRQEEAEKILGLVPDRVGPSESIEAAIVRRRLRDSEKAHSLFKVAGRQVWEDVRALMEFAQTKMDLASRLHRSKRQAPADLQAQHQLLREAEEMLERVVLMEAPRTRKAWAWLELGRVRKRLDKPRSEIDDAVERAQTLDPGDTRLRNQLARLRR